MPTRTILVLLTIIALGGCLPEPERPSSTNGPSADVGVDADPGEPDADPGEPDADPGEPDADPVEPYDPGPCDGDFGEDFEVYAVDGAGFWRTYSAPTATNGAVIAGAQAGTVRVIHVDGEGQVLGEHAIPGNDVYGIATNDTSFALLVQRANDVLALVVREFSGNTLEDKTLIGDVDTTVEGNEWFGHLLRDGRITWTGEHWAAYYTLTRMWPDGVGHYGDQLRLFEADGSDHTTVWGWGCSHSMEVQIAHNGERLGPVCSSDCYPNKGVHFNHQTFIYPDEGLSNCAGGYGTSLGASIPVDGGFWIPFTATDDRDSHDVAVVHIEGWGTVGEVLWLTEDDVDATFLNGANFGEDIVVAFRQGTEDRFYLLDGDDGSVLTGPEVLPEANLGSVLNFFVYSNGDVGWVQGAELARLRSCD